MRFLKIIPASLLLLLLGVMPALAAEEGHHGLNWLDFALRVTTVVIVVIILWKAAGKIIAKMVNGRKEAVVKEIDDLAEQKREAQHNLTEVEHKVANLDSECKELVSEGETQAQAIRAAIVTEGRRQAEQIVAQAKAGAEQEGKSETDSIRAALADEIVAEMEKSLRLSQDDHLALIDKSLAKVVMS